MDCRVKPGNDDIVDEKRAPKGLTSAMFEPISAPPGTSGLSAFE
jgi:hypothetical protein